MDNCQYHIILVLFVFGCEPLYDAFDYAWIRVDI